MTNVGAIFVTLQGADTPAAALSVPADTRTALAAVAASTSLSDGEKTTLVAVAAVADSGALSANDRELLISQVGGLGNYYNNTVNKTWPRWTLTGALRTYGLNLAAAKAQVAAGNAAAVAASAQKVLSTPTPTPTPAPAEPTPPPPVKQPGETGHLVEKVV